MPGPEISRQIPEDLTRSTSGVDNQMTRVFVGTALVAAGTPMLGSSDARVQAAGGVLNALGFAINLKIGSQLNRAQGVLSRVRTTLRDNGQ
jgi:hypothetical protein